jgi:hypothetical protein
MTLEETRKELHDVAEIMQLLAGNLADDAGGMAKILEDLPSGYNLSAKGREHGIKVYRDVQARLRNHADTLEQMARGLEQKEG